MKIYEKASGSKKEFAKHYCCLKMKKRYGTTIVHRSNAQFSVNGTEIVLPKSGEFFVLEAYYKNSYDYEMRLMYDEIFHCPFCGSKIEKVEVDSDLVEPDEVELAGFMLTAIPKWTGKEMVEERNRVEKMLQIMFPERHFLYICDDVWEHAFYRYIGKAE